MKKTVTGALGLRAKLLGTTEPQPITMQANIVCRHISAVYGGTKKIGADVALQEERELEYVLDLAHQITDHPKFPDYTLFSDAVDAWILEIKNEVDKHEPGN